MAGGEVVTDDDDGLMYSDRSEVLLRCRSAIKRSSLPVGRGVLRLDRRVVGQEAAEIAGRETDEINNMEYG